MINSINSASQNVVAGSNVLFNADRVRTQSCCCGWLAHEQGTGLFTITKPGIYRINYNADITSATTGEASLALKQNGEEIIGSESTYTIATANAVGSVGASILLRVPCNTSYTISLANNSALELVVTDPNLVIERIA